MIMPRHSNSKRMRAPRVTDPEVRPFKDLEYMLWQGEIMSPGESDCIQANCVTGQRKAYLNLSMMASLENLLVFLLNILTTSSLVIPTCSPIGKRQSAMWL
jgi:hypothetical protein